MHMESYIEVTGINNILIMFVAQLIACYLQMRPLRLRDMMMYSIVITLGCILLWEDWAWWGMLFLESICFWLFYRDKVRVYLLAFILRGLISLSDYVLFGGSFHLLAYFVEVNKSLILVQWFLLIVIAIALISKWKYLFAQVQYVYRIRLFCRNRKLKMFAYLDSGNLLMNEGIPIIFINSKYLEYLKNENIELIVMNTMNATSVVQAYLLELQVEGYSRHKVYACLEGKMKIPMQCNCLLNVHNLSMG